MTAAKPIPFDYELVTVADSAVGLTAATYAGAYKAVCTLEDAPIRICVDGTTPSADAIGHLVQIDDVINLKTPEEITAFLAIRTGSTSGKLRATYYR